MTDATFKKKKNNEALPGQRISTHPSYREYSWDSISRPKAPQRDNNIDQSNGNRRGASQASSNAKASAFYGNPADARRSVGARNTSGKTRSSDAHGKTRAAAHKSAAKSSAERAKSASAIKVQAAKVERLRKKSITKLHTIVVEKKYQFPLSIVLTALCFTVLILAIVTTSVQISEIVAENSNLERQYNALISEENELRLQLEVRDDLRVVESVAKNDIGMVKKDQVERHYITVRKEDKIELVEEEIEEKTNILDGILSFGGSIVERVRDFFGM